MQRLSSLSLVLVSIAACKGETPTEGKKLTEPHPPAETSQGTFGANEQRAPASVDLQSSAEAQAVAQLFCKGGAPVFARRAPTQSELAEALPQMAEGFQLSRKGVEYEGPHPVAAYVIFEDDKLAGLRTLEVRITAEGPWMKSPKLATGTLVDSDWTVGFVSLPCGMTARGNPVSFRDYLLEVGEQNKRVQSGEARLKIGTAIGVELILKGARDHQEIVGLVKVLAPTQLETLVSALTQE
jgi:hypothetical protein